jgi:hypothetical protein
MTNRSNNKSPASKPLHNEIEPATAYQNSMTLIRERLLAIEKTEPSETPLMRAERIGFQVRKIIEGVAYGALSAAEVRNKQVLLQQRSKDADKLLSWLHSKSMLVLPSAQRLEPPPSAEYRIVMAGAGSEDLARDDLKSMYSRASSLVHERHPEQLTSTQIENDLNSIERDASRLRSWLWLHIMFLRGEGFLVQMGQFGTESFMVSIKKMAELPEEYAS